MMQGQILAAIIAATLLVGAIVPYQFAIAQEEIAAEPEPTITDIVDIVKEEVGNTVEEIVDESAELTDAVEATAEEVLTDPEVKPEIIEATGNVTAEVSETPEPSDVIVTLDANTTTTEVLESIGNVNDTDVVEAVIVNEVADEIVTTDIELGNEVATIVCDIFIDVLDGTPVADAIANATDDIAVAVEDNVTPAEVAEAVDNVNATDVAEEIVTGETDVEDGVQEVVEDDLSGDVVTPTPTDPEPETPDTDDGSGHGNKADHAEIIDLLEDIKALLAQAEPEPEPTVPEPEPEVPTNSTG